MLSSLNLAKHWTKLGEAVVGTRKRAREVRHALLLSRGMVRTLDVVKRQEQSLLCPQIMMWRCADEIRVRLACYRGIFWAT